MSVSYFRILSAGLFLIAACEEDAPLLPPPTRDYEADSNLTGDTGDNDEHRADGSEYPGGARPPDEVRDAEHGVLTELRAQHKILEKQQLHLAKRDSDLRQLQNELESRMTNISDLERRLQAHLGIGKLARERRDERVSALADLIATMPPQAGAEIVAQMSDKDAQWLLLSVARKSDRKAAKLMALMPAERAAQLGQIYLDTDPESAVQDEDLLHGISKNLPGPPTPTTVSPLGINPTSSAQAPRAKPAPTDAAGTTPPTHDAVVRDGPQRAATKP
ncbi:MAG: hypothetical protein V3V08_13840 [Nannocystaceae bacterium]